MSGLLDRIVRRRRASASSRLGPASFNGNGATAPRAAPTRHVNGSAPATVPAPPVPMPVAAPAPPETAPEPEPQTETEPETVLAPASEPEPPELFELAPAVVAFPTVQDAPEITDPDPEPAAPEPDPGPEHDPAPETSGFLERGRIRRRARYLRQLRELELRDLGGFLVELGRFGHERPELVQAKLQRALHTDAELRTLDRALGSEEPLREIRAAGIGGTCANCGAVHGSSDRYCASCGEPVGGRR
jgi:hypothetical protein